MRVMIADPPTSRRRNTAPMKEDKAKNMRKKVSWGNVWTVTWLLDVQMLLLLMLLLVLQGRPASPATRKNPSDFLVTGLDEIEPAFADYPGKMYSGLLPVDHGDVVKGELMFWLFAPDEPIGVSNQKTLTTWLNGGPGCSSFFAGIFFEHGPVTIPLVRFPSRRVCGFSRCLGEVQEDQVAVVDACPSWTLSPSFFTWDACLITPCCIPIQMLCANTIDFMGYDVFFG
jgi:hypothetical protein